MLFADDAALVSHTNDGLQRLMDHFAGACKEFALTISIKKTEVMTQDAPIPPTISINDSRLETVDNFRYLGSIISSNVSLDAEINARIGNAAAVMSKLQKRVWENKNLTLNTKMKVYQACVLSTLLYGSKTWTTHAKQEKKLNVFHMRCLCKILGITWEDKVTNSEVLSKAKLSTIFAMLSERRLRWLVHVHRMEEGRIPKDLLYGQLECGSRPRGRPHLRYRDSCKRDLQSANININSWEDLASQRSAWRVALKSGINRAEEDRCKKQASKREKRKAFVSPPDTTFICDTCTKDCHSRIGLYSHCRSCSLAARRNPSSSVMDGGQ
ncbi:hypothetical protein BSL78_29151 [Apostichopus japonicus]|uniref:Reverse transcriptase domain-containing protein n=1 Tax=Stichopus japonicus TaxID=307972 RepID=A0A2G8JE57_STIJA|nr:hypothetical protein BSL78_29151 [Apostichopus japonicus]